MADKNSDQEKTEEPTQRKIKKAREDGNVSISKEISSVMLMIVSIVIFMGSGGFMYGKLESIFQLFLTNSTQPLDDQEQAIEYLEMAMWLSLEMMMPIMLMLFVTAVLVNVAQTNGALSLKAVSPKASNMNPINGIKKIFSMKGFVELIKGFIKLFIVSIVVYYTVRNDIDHFVSFIMMPVETSLSETGIYVLMFVGRILAALFILSVADAVYQRFQHHKDLRMSKQEVKDEYKQMEGDPKMKSERKKMGMSFRNRKRLDHAVLSSDVVVTNPTHYAVALHYDPENSEAPIVMAKGKRLRALRIKELAREYGIPIVENKPVAQALFASAEEDEYIPADLYKAVAEILGYIYKLNNKHKL